uniref:G-protein coupled receptors family 1 profile domain-containing protein n=1 Tax=Labrus bergylta TaxID=56723 RepID=A0A3Q3EMR3_9LABR
MQCNFNGTLLISVLPPLLATEFVFGLLGNGLALWIFLLLFNLAVADFLLTMALPFRASCYSSGIKWRFGGAFCNICLFLLAMNRSGSTVFFLMVIALDRYMHVVHPHHPINSLSISKAWRGGLALWLITICMTTHVFTLKHINTTYCESFMTNTEPSHNLTWHKFEFIFSFYLPLLVILYCTIHIIVVLRGRQLVQDAKIQRALCFLTVVAVLFIFCFLPSNIMQLLIWITTKKVHSTLQESEVCPALEDLTTAFYISISLTLNSALDPLVYYFSSSAVKNKRTVPGHGVLLHPSECSGVFGCSSCPSDLHQLWSQSDVRRSNNILEV